MLLLALGLAFLVLALIDGIHDVRELWRRGRHSHKNFLGHRGA